MLQDLLEDSLEQLQAMTFMHDGAPCHSAKLVKNWLHSRNISTLFWPGQSADLNPIENIWHVMKRKVSLLQPTSLAHLKQVIQQVWQEQISPDFCRKLTDTMPARIAAVKKNKGGPCKY